MKFGVREICDVVFKAKQDVTIGNSEFKVGQPVLYIDTAKTSTLEGAATTVYATGGKGNTNLIAWEGEKTLTFTVEDALLSPIGFSVLSGAGLFKAKNETTVVHVHTTASGAVSTSAVDDSLYIDLTNAMLPADSICGTAPIFAVKTEADGSVTGALVKCTLGDEAEGLVKTLKVESGAVSGDGVFVDFYVTRKGNTVSELQIDAGTFGGYYYVEASTLFRDQSTGKDMPAEITLPNVKIQSNFSFSMASTGDPSTFSFVMDAFPGYTIFDKTKKVLCVIQVIEDTVDKNANLDSVMKHDDDERFKVEQADKTMIEYEDSVADPVAKQIP